MIKCNYKGCNINEENETESNKLHLHHLVPKSIGGIDINGRRWLCKKHHNILHLMIVSIVWKYIPEDKKEECKEVVKRFSLRLMEKNEY